MLDSCRNLEQEGKEVTYLPVQSNGLIDLQLLEKSIREDTVVVSVMAVNNEIGVIQPLKVIETLPSACHSVPSFFLTTKKEIGEICRKNNVFFHTDAAQAVGKIPIDVDEMNIDILSISGHKVYGPKGIGGNFQRPTKNQTVEPHHPLYPLIPPPSSPLCQKAATGEAGADH